jgi:hypothetical protein
MSNEAPELTEKNYFLKCKIKIIKKSVQDHDRQYERTLVILVPEDTDQRTSFLRAWLPEDQGQHYELVGMIAPPIDSPCRLSIHRGPDEKSERHYLFVMSKGVEDIILKYAKEGDTLKVQILPESEEEIVDQARDTDGDYDLISGQEQF